MDLIYKPKILNLTKKPDKDFFNDVFSDSIIIDQVVGQLAELVKLKNPKLKLDKKPKKIEELITEHLKGISFEQYGLWVFYPWSKKLVHIVYEDEFIELRTIRNRYKITHDEQLILQQKVIGIVGLSVGHAIALTVASERICGELRIADFDSLELTNLNRIKTGIDNLGLKKTVITAREISEIDPFINVTCFHEGISDETIDEFLTKDKKLDLCIEECDSFYEKFNIRKQCQKLGIPVLMDTSDKGLIDVERFDLEANREIFHGLTSVKDWEKLRNLTTDEKVPYFYEIINENSMSIRMRASLIEIGESITGWPQLSSAVTFGSGMATDVTRRILLDQFKASGRYSVDIEELINDYDNETKKSSTNTLEKNNTETDYFIQSQKTHSLSSFDSSFIEEIVSKAIKAPSGGNSQPWKWIWSNDALYLSLDTTRCGVYTDVNNWAAIMSLGCATENLVLSAYKQGLQTTQEIIQSTSEAFSIKFSFSTTSSSNDTKIYNEELYNLIDIRQSNRNNSSSQPLEKLHKKELINAVTSVQGANLRIIEDKRDIAALAEIIAEGDLIRFLNKFLFNEMMTEIRWDKDDAIKRPYGVELDLFEITPKEKIGFRIANSWAVASFVKKIGGNALGDLSRKLLNNGSALALITMPKRDNLSYFQGGISVERFWLTATKYQVAVHPFVALCYFFTRLEISSLDFFSSSEIKKLKSLRVQWTEVLNISHDDAELFFAKLSYSPPADMSQRIPVQQVLDIK